MLSVGYLSRDETSTIRLTSRSISPPRYTVIEYDEGIERLRTNAQYLPSYVRADPPAHSFLMYTRTTLSVPISALVN